ncbi:UNVERIFIED_CONTAM: RNA polymerase sigma factor (sigma-70 family) [Brevibacillus sp. OAP136]
MQKFEEMPQTDMEQLYKMYWPLLFSIAYRLLGTRSEAEDIVQDVFVSLQAVDRGQVDNMKAFLSRAVTNRCLNLLKSAKKQRELYVGPWLPEPLYALEGNEPLQRLEQQEDISYAYLVMLDQLSPIERVSFVLREAFGYEYEEIAENRRQISRKLPENLQPRTAENEAGAGSERKTSAARGHCAALWGFAANRADRRGCGASLRPGRVFLRWRREGQSGAAAAHRHRAGVCVFGRNQHQRLVFQRNSSRAGQRTAGSHGSAGWFAGRRLVVWL